MIQRLCVNLANAERASVTRAQTRAETHGSPGVTVVADGGRADVSAGGSAATPGSRIFAEFPPIEDEETEKALDEALAVMFSTIEGALRLGLTEKPRLLRRREGLERSVLLRLNTEECEFRLCLTMKERPAHVDEPQRCARTGTAPGCPTQSEPEAARDA